MKHIYYIIFVLVLIIIEFGFILPFLISSNNSELVLLGFAILFFVSPYLGFLLFNKIKKAYINFHKE
jgi:archaellum biogenesis protein FlaJ (TadC family)